MKNLLLFTFIYWLLAIGYSPVLAEEYPVCTEELPRPDVEKGPTRQYPCNTCYEEMPEPVSLFCGDLFQAQDRVTYLQDEGEEDPPHWVTKTWEGNLEIDLTDTELPLVGKANSEITDKEIEDQTRVWEYLADYFEGPAFYDYEPINLEEEDPEKLKEEIKRVLTYSGVFRKLAPKEWQDKLKVNMVYRAQNLEPPWSGPTDRVHNYLVCYVKNAEIVSPDESGSEELRLKDFVSFLKPLRADFPTDEDYEQALNEWKTKEIKGIKVETLWPYIPMFTRENVPGEIELELEKEHNDDSLTISSDPSNQKILVPHLARLNEVSEQIYKIFHVAVEKLNSWQKPYLAQPKNLPTSHSQVLSATEPTPTPDFGFCDYEDEALTNPGDKICGQVITANLNLTERFENPYYEELPTPTPPEDPCDPPECDDPSECPVDYFCLNHCCLAPIPPKEYPLDTERKINILVKIPFLDELWQKIVIGDENESITQSIFRIFFPHEEINFEDYDYPGVGETIYKYRGSSDSSRPGVIAGDGKPGSEAKIYYKHLGGIRCIRDKVLKLLLPSDVEFTPYCLD